VAPPNLHRVGFFVRRSASANDREPAGEKSPTGSMRLGRMLWLLRRHPPQTNSQSAIISKHSASVSRFRSIKWIDCRRTACPRLSGFIYPQCMLGTSRGLVPVTTLLVYGELLTQYPRQEPERWAKASTST